MFKDKIESSKAQIILKSLVIEYSTFLEKMKSLTPRMAEEFFCTLQVIDKDFYASIGHIESMKKLLEWCVKAQSSKKLHGQLEVFKEIVSEVIKVDLMKVLFFDLKTRTFSTVAQTNKVEVDEQTKHFVASETMMAEMKAMQTVITPYFNTDENFNQNIENCFDEPISSYAFVPMVDSSSQEFKGTISSARRGYPCQQIHEDSRHQERRPVFALVHSQRVPEIPGSCPSSP